MPLFAFANASISFEHFTLADIEGVTLSVFIALVLGKLLGIFSFTWLAVKSKLLNMPEHMDARSLLGVSMLGGIGFTSPCLSPTSPMPGSPTSVLPCSTKPN